VSDRAFPLSQPRVETQARILDSYGKLPLSLEANLRTERCPGKVSFAHVSQPLGYGLDEEAIKAVKKWKFNPANVSGQPVTVRISVNVAFRLHE
jgi:TonB family protein